MVVWTVWDYLTSVLAQRVDWKERLLESILTKGSCVTQNKNTEGRITWSSSIGIVRIFHLVLMMLYFLILFYTGSMSTFRNVHENLKDVEKFAFSCGYVKGSGWWDQQNSIIKTPVHR